MSTSGATALYDGLYVVLKEFERERRAATQVRRQVLVLLSDGIDTKSRLTFEDVMDLARRAGVNIYVIALQGDVALVPRARSWTAPILRAEYTMGAVARESGGRTFFPKSARELPAIYDGDRAGARQPVRARLHAGAAGRRRRLQTRHGPRAPADECARADAKRLLRRRAQEREGRRRIASNA